MPFLFPVLGDFVYALLFLCVAGSIGVLTSFLNGFVPNPGIFGVHPLQFIHDGIDDIHSWAVNTCDSAILRLRNVFVDIGHVVVTLVKAELGVISAAYDLIFHVNNTTVPNATSQAESQARNEVAAAAQDATNQFNKAEDNLTAAKAALVADLDYLRNTTLPQELNSTKAAVEAELVSAINGVDGQLAQLGNAMTTDLANVWDVLNPLNTAVSSTIPAELTQLGVKEQSDVAAASASAKSDLLAATAVLGTELENAKSDLANQIAQSKAASDALAAADLSTAEGQAAAISAQDSLQVAQAAAASLAVAVSGLQAKIDANTAAITTLEATEVISLPSLNDISIPSSITVPIAVGALAVSVAGIISEIDQCMVTACEGPNNYLNLINSALGAFNIVELVTFLQSVVHDPTGEAKALSSVAGDLYSEGHSLIDGLLSL